MSVMKKLVVGNWKMHGSRAFNAELIQGLLVADLATTAPNADVAVCPPCVFLADVADALQGSAIAVGTQDISAQTQGAYTGEVAGPMIREFGATYAIVGHSERRSYHAESDQLVADKAKALGVNAAAGKRGQDQRDNQNEGLKETLGRHGSALRQKGINRPLRYRRPLQIALS